MSKPESPAPEPKPPVVYSTRDELRSALLATKERRFQPITVTFKGVRVVGCLKSLTLDERDVALSKAGVFAAARRGEGAQPTSAEITTHLLVASLFVSPEPGSPLVFESGDIQELVQDEFGGWLEQVGKVMQEFVKAASAAGKVSAGILTG